ncbi:MAG: hypothetical protein R3C39_11365 [Dehalococcoidia bacterium]
MRHSKRRVRRPRWLLRALLVLGMLGALTACGGGESDSASGELRVHDAAVTTRVATVDEVSAAVAGRDVDALMRLVAFQSVDCVAPPGEYGGRPTCDAGTADGTGVERFPISIGELTWTADARPFLEQLVEASEGLWAVVDGRAVPREVAYLPSVGDYRVLFAVAPEGQGSCVNAVTIEDDSIVALVLGCLSPANGLGWLGAPLPLALAPAN